MDTQISPFVHLGDKADVATLLMENLQLRWMWRCSVHIWTWFDWFLRLLYGLRPPVLYSIYEVFGRVWHQFCVTADLLCELI